MKALVLLVLLWTTHLWAADFKPYTKNNTPSLKLVDLEGKTYNLAQYQGNVVLVQFWATYCSSCIKEMPSMNRLQAKLKKQGVPFKILAVNMAEDVEAVQQFVQKIKPEFTILLDKTGANIGTWGVFAVPSNFIIGTDGKIKYTLFGGIDWEEDEVIQTITQLAKE